jgi:hypothetical protein
MIGIFRAVAVTHPQKRDCPAFVDELVDSNDVTRLLMGGSSSVTGVGFRVGFVHTVWYCRLVVVPGDAMSALIVSETMTDRYFCRIRHNDGPDMGRKE